MFLIRFRDYTAFVILPLSPAVLYASNLPEWNKHQLQCDPDSYSLAEIKEMPKVSEICKSGQYQNRLMTCISYYFCEQNTASHRKEIYLWSRSEKKLPVKFCN